MTLDMRCPTLSCVPAKASSTWNLAKKLRGNGLSYRAIAKETGLPRATLAYTARKQNWPVGVAVIDESLPPTQVSAIDAVAYELNEQVTSDARSRLKTLARMEPAHAREMRDYAVAQSVLYRNCRLALGLDAKESGPRSLTLVALSASTVPARGPVIDVECVPGAPPTPSPAASAREGGGVSTTTSSPEPDYSI